MAKNTKPAIRFKGFTDAWEQRKLGEICEKITMKNTNMDVTETFTNSAEFGIISQRDFFDHDIAKQDKIDGYYIVHPEDFVYNPRISVTAPVGPINRNKLGRCGVMSPLYSVFRPNGMDNTFLEQFFKSSYWHSFMRLNGDSGARSDRFSIKDSVFFDMPIPCPNLQEQESVGRFLYSIDNLITLHQRKYDSLVNVKKAMLEKMFPKNGETVPEIRFKGFTDAWEQRKLVNDLKSIQTGTNKLGSTENTGMPLLKMGNIQRGYFSLDKLEYLDENDVVEPENIAYKGDFFFNTRNTLDLVGKGATWTGDSGKYAFNSNIARFNLGELDTIFFNYLYNTGSMQKQVHARAMGTTSVAAIYPRTLDSITYCIPCKEEQLKIGYCLKNIDDLITLHQRKQFLKVRR